MASVDRCPLCGVKSIVVQTNTGPMCSECLNFELVHFPLDHEEISEYEKYERKRQTNANQNYFCLDEYFA